jgi:hypothetical protein
LTIKTAPQSPRNFAPHHLPLCSALPCLTPWNCCRGILPCAARRRHAPSARTTGGLLLDYPGILHYRLLPRPTLVPEQQRGTLSKSGGHSNHAARFNGRPLRPWRAANRRHRRPSQRCHRRGVLPVPRRHYLPARGAGPAECACYRLMVLYLFCYFLHGPIAYSSVP